jgi:hypothetical protein
MCRPFGDPRKEFSAFSISVQLAAVKLSKIESQVQSRKHSISITDLFDCHSEEYHKKRAIIPTPVTTFKVNSGKQIRQALKINIGYPSYNIKIERDFLIFGANTVSFLDSIGNGSREKKTARTTGKNIQ